MADLQALKAKLPIDELAKQLGIQFDTEGARFSKALCPFHNDSNPSFSVDKLSQTARCFNATCIASRPMDHVRLIRMMKHLSEEEAMDLLYELAGEERPFDGLSDYLRRVLDRLHGNVGMDIPKDFFAGRGITEDALNRFRVGYSPSYEWFKEAIADVPVDAIVKLELNQPHIFNDAIIYPQFDALSRVTGYRARPFSSAQKYYANGKDYPLRPARIYGLNFVKGSQIVLLEGPNDVLSWYSQGVRNVAGLNGNKTKDLERFLVERGFSDIVFIGDGDEGGRSAMMSAPPLVRVNMIPVTGAEKLDPDEYAVKHGLMGVVQLINQARYPFDIKLDAKLSSAREGLTDKISLVKSIAQDLSDGLPYIVMMQVQDRIAKALGMTREDISSMFDLVDLDTDEYEAKVLSHIVLKGPMADDLRVKIMPWMFADPVRRQQFEEILKGVELSSFITDRGLLTESDVERFIDMAKRKRLKRLLNKASSSVSNMSLPIEDLSSDAVSNIFNLSYGNIQVVSSREQLTMGIQNAMERYNNMDKLLGISFGANFPQTNDVLQGLRPNTIYILAATQGTGKSALALEWAIDMAFRQDIPVLWVSLEMSELDMSTRILSKLTGVSAKRIMNGKMEGDEVMRIASSPIRYMGKPLHMISASGMTVAQLVAIVRREKMSKGIKAVFLDYLQLVRGNSNLNNMYERVGAISQDIKQGIVMDKEIGLPVVAIAQLQRQAVKAAVPISEHMAESYKVAMDADVIMTIKKRTPEEQQADTALGRNWGNMLLNIDKNRSGEDKQLIGLYFNRSDLTIKEVDV
jgi:replicative DNA helicase